MFSPQPANTPANVQALADQLGALAMEFRSAKEIATQTQIAAGYEKVVEQLINSGQWRDVPPPEDQLPDDWMPDSFKRYWGLP